ncbi:TetR/AcrR family transcriptional regulator C-terminal domain-containing protein [Streptomyces canus]|uniref:TetR/AcrR family transcriptional regulator C-terminal domain-containing protein n=1 Tax=Streptomyces canus TaxID=58343 RepID=UPI002E2A6175|nr:TetR/AcrR family transcriptional regulator C-terminal domain-containing protein [Streptomyces canus]
MKTARPSCPRRALTRACAASEDEVHLLLVLSPRSDHIGRDYACLVSRPGTAALCCLIITELPQMPELADIVGNGFAIDRGPFFDRLRDYLDAEAQAGTLDFRSADGQTQPLSV